MSGSLLDTLAHPAQVNLLEAYGGAAKTANEIWRTRQQQANQLAGQAQQDGVDANGVYQPATANALMKGYGPAGALAARQMLESSQALGTQGQAQGKDTNASVVNAISAALRPDPNDPNDTQLHAKVAAGMQGLIDTGAIPRQQGMTALVSLPNDPAALRAHLEQRRVSLLPPEQQQQNIYGTRQPVNTGGTTEFPVVPPASAGGPGPVVPMTPTPGQRNETQPTWDPATRTFRSTPRQDVAPMVDGQGNPIPGSAVPGLPSSGRPPPPGTVATPPPATNIEKPSPGTEDEMRGAAGHAIVARDRANNYQANIYPIEGAITALQGADTGKAGETLNNIRGLLGDTPLRYLSAFLPATLSDQEKRAAYDEANKYTTGMALAAPGGTRSNAGEAASAAANPSVHISNAAALAVSKSILAQRRMEQAGTLAFNKTSQPGANYDSFMNTWSTTQDPRGFMADRMSGAERAAMVKEMGGVGSDAYKRFKASYLAGQDAGVTDANR